MGTKVNFVLNSCTYFARDMCPLLCCNYKNSTLSWKTWWGSVNLSFNRHLNCSHVNMVNKFGVICSCTIHQSNTWSFKNIWVEQNHSTSNVYPCVSVKASTWTSHWQTHCTFKFFSSEGVEVMGLHKLGRSFCFWGSTHLRVYPTLGSRPCEPHYVLGALLGMTLLTPSPLQ